MADNGVYIDHTLDFKLRFDERASLIDLDTGDHLVIVSDEGRVRWAIEATEHGLRIRQDSDYSFEMSVRPEVANVVHVESRPRHE